MSSCNPSLDFFCSRWRSSPNQPSRVALGWPLTILKAPNPMGQSARSEKDLATFKNSHPVSLMAQSCVCCSSCQNSHDGKDKLADGTSTEGNNRRTPAPIATRVFTSAVALVVALFAASGSGDYFLVRYLEDDLQQIIKTILEARPLSPPALAPVLPPVIAAAPHYKGPRGQLIEAWFPYIYWGKTHLECYNFF